MKAITGEQKRQRQEPMRQQLVQRQEPMRQQLVQLQVRLQVRLQVLVLELLFCRKRTKQQQR
jgi:hypothetical protein